MLYILVGFIFFVIFLSIAVYVTLEKKVLYSDLKRRHVVVTGGSSGIGKAAAVEAARLGAHVTVIGRDEQRLKAAVKEISSHAKEDQKIQYAALDVTSNYAAIERCFQKLEADIGPIFMLINSAGSCICGQFDKMKVEDIKQMIDLNYFGTAYCTRYVLPGMKERNEGLIVFVASEAALIGIYGYSAYSAAKWAVRGLAESVFMELVGTGVRLTLAFPPDTDTPGFKNEELTKPQETKDISGTGGLKSPEDVGKKIVKDALKGKLYSVFGFSGTLLTYAFCGSIESVVQVIIQVISLGLLRLITVVTIISFNNIVKNGLKKKNESVKDK